MSSREPLSEEERALARRLDEWSPGSPSAALDARILAQSQSAVAISLKPSRRPWLISVASAAVLVLTVGVVWRTVQAPRDESLIAPPATPASDLPAMQRKQALDRVEVSGSRIASPPHTDAAEALSVPDAMQSPPADQTESTGPGTARNRAERQSVPTPDLSPAERQPKVLPATPPTIGATALPAPPPAPPPPPPPEPAPAPAVPPAEMSYHVPVPSSPTASEDPIQEQNREHADNASDRLRRSAAGQAAAALPRSPAAATQREHDQDTQSEHERGGDTGTTMAPLVGEAALDSFDSRVEAIRELVRRQHMAEARKAIEQLRRDYPRKSLPRDVRALERRPDPRR